MPEGPVGAGRGAEEAIAVGLFFAEGWVVELLREAVEDCVARGVEGVGVLRARVADAADEERERTSGGH